MTKVNEKKRKLILVSVTFVLCITIMLSGTFAWQSISQTALNETMGEMTNPGGRLHDDFNGSNKDIYVENFTSTTDGMDIIVRIRLSEYMEIGEDAGNNKDSADRDVEVLTKQDDGSDADINKTDTWDLYTPIDTNNNHYGYWSWDLSGGKTVYMPTANKDTDSLLPDRNGTYPFDDYKTYTLGEVAEDGSGRKAVETIDGTVMSMEYWLTEGGKKLGNYWVYDGDGWAYWANPLGPQEATGLLLSGIGHSRTIDKKWYYGIYVECQMVTADEVGSTTNPVGFYSEKAKKAPSESARDLLDAIIKEIGYTQTEAGNYGMLTTDATEEELLMMLEKEAEAEEETVTEIEETEENSTDSGNTEEDPEDTTKDENTEEDKKAEDSNDSDTPEDDLTGGDTTDNEPADGDVTDNEPTVGDETGETTTGDTTVGTGEDDTAGGNSTEDTENNTSVDDTTQTSNEPPITEPETTVTQKTAEENTTDIEAEN